MRAVMKGGTMASAAEIQRRMFDVIEERDLEALREMYHPDYVYVGPEGVEEKGADAGIAVAREFTNAFPDLRFEIRNQFTPSDEVAIIELTARGTHQAELEGIPATGRPIEMRACNIVEVAADGRIRQEREYWDNMTLMQQLGVVDS